MRQDRTSITLSTGGKIRIGYDKYPEWATVFEPLNDCCDRCWKDSVKYTRKRDSDKWICGVCRHYEHHKNAMSDWEVIKRKTILRIKRIWWNRNSGNKIPNSPGHS